MNTTKYELVQVGDEIFSPFRDGPDNHYIFVDGSSAYFANETEIDKITEFQRYDFDSQEMGTAFQINAVDNQYLSLTWNVSLKSGVVSYHVSDDSGSFLKQVDGLSGSEIASVLLDEDYVEYYNLFRISDGNVLVFRPNDSSGDVPPELKLINPLTYVVETVYLDSSSRHETSSASFVELSNGNIVVHWEDNGDSKGIVIDSSGTVLIEDIDLFSDNFGSSTYFVEISALPAGGFVTAAKAEGAAYVSRLQIFDDFGTAVGDAIDPNSLHDDVNGTIQAMTVTDEGQIVLTMEQIIGVGPSQVLILNSDGELVSDVQELHPSDWGDTEFADHGTETLTALSNGNIVHAQSVLDESIIIYDINAIAEGSVSIAGDLFVEDTLTATPTAIDEDGVDDSSWTYQWYIAGETDEMIAGATGATFELTSETAGKEVFVEASFTDLLGNISTFTSETTGTITGVFSAEAGGSQLIGTALAEVFNGAEGNDTIFANGGDDTISGAAGADQIRAGAGLDTVVAGEGNDTVYGDADNDSLLGGDGADALFGGFGKDKLFGEDGDDDLSGGEQNDLLEGGSGTDTLTGDSGKDRLFGGAGDDSLSGGDQNDKLYGGEGSDVLAGDGGKDKLFGGDGGDVLSGGAKNDRLFGEEGDDFLFGDKGKDTLSGGVGSDTLDGGRQNDVLTGGADSDTFMMDIGYKGKDRITDFDGADTLLFYKKSEALDFDAESFVDKYASETSEGVQFSFGKRKQLIVEGVFTAEELIENISFDYL